MRRLAPDLDTAPQQQRVHADIGMPRLKAAAPHQVPIRIPAMPQHRPKGFARLLQPPLKTTQRIERKPQWHELGELSRNVEGFPCAIEEGYREHYTVFPTEARQIQARQSSQQFCQRQR